MKNRYDLELSRCARILKNVSVLKFLVRYRIELRIVIHLS